MSRLGDLIARHAPLGAGPVRIGDHALISATGHEGPPEFDMTGVAFVLLARGGKRIAAGGHVHEYRPGQSLVASADLPATGSFFDATPERPALGFALRLDPAVIAELLLAGGPAVDADAVGRSAATVSVAELTPDILDAVTRLVALAGRPADLPVLAPLIERELIWLLLRGAHGAAVRQLGIAHGRVHRVGDAVALLRERFAERVTVDELARRARMSPSAFHRAFHAVTAMSPIQFQKLLRLQEARVRLLAGGADIAGIAYAVGYGSPSQFSRDYKRQFGSAPSRDARTG